MEILYLGGLKQTVYFDTGRLQGYPLCEIDFFHFVIGFPIRGCEKVYRKNWLPPKNGYPQKIGYPKKLILKKNGYPQKKCYPKKNDQKKNGDPKKIGELYCEGGLLLIFGKMAYFIL